MVLLGCHKVLSVQYGTASIKFALFFVHLDAKNVGNAIKQVLCTLFFWSTTNKFQVAQD